MLPVVLIVVLCFSLGLGKVLSEIFIKNNPVINNENKDNVKKVPKENDSTIEIVKFTMVQCGYFKEKENALDLKNKLNKEFESYLINDNDKIKVVVGIFCEDKMAEDISNKLSEKGFNNIRTSFQVVKNDLCDSEIAEILNANIKILNKFGDKNVKSIKTDELKKWVNSLEKVDSKSENYALLEQIKDYTLKLPEEIQKDKLETYYNSLYGFLVKMKK